MPPKKKKGKGKKKKKDDGELTVEDKYKKTLDEIAALKDHLASRKELARRAQTAGSEWETRKKEAELTLEEFKEDQKAISSDMTRQYKTMQTEMGLQIHQLKSDLARTQKQLEDTQSELSKTMEEKEQMCREKDDKINDLTLKLETMGSQYESILHNAMDNLAEKIQQSSVEWEIQSTGIQDRNKQTLLEFGLHPLYL